ncbi:MAG: YncE family protein [Steroidobacteraceae bacterium]
MSDSVPAFPAQVRVRALWMLTAALAVLASSAAASAAPARTALRRVGEIAVPGRPLRKFDIGYVNAAGIYAFADKSNHGLDLIDASTGRFLGRAGGFGTDGPKGVVAVGTRTFWASDGDSGTVKVVDVRTRRIIASVLTERGKTTDELTYDPRDHLLAVVAKHDGPPILNLISTRSRTLVGRVTLAAATDGAEQPVYVPATGLLYLSLPVLHHVKADGAIAVINPRTRRLVKLIHVRECMPAGLALGPRSDLLIGCSDDAVTAGFPARSLILNARSGKIIARIPQVGGSDEVYADRRAHRYYLAAVKNPGGAVLGIVNARTHRWIANLPSGPDAHSVAADPRSGKVFVPIAASLASGPCREGCVAVFAPR